jgi:SAM-dependent methyltransferase
MDNLIKQYNNELINNSSNYNNNTEFEITYHLYLNDSIYKNIFNKLKDISSSITIHEYINIYYDNKIRVTKQFKDSINLNKDIILKKNSLSKPLKYTSNNHNIKYYNIKLNNEEDLTKKLANTLNSQEIKLIKIKLRISFLLKNNDNYKIDLDLVKNINIKQNNIKEIKNRLFKSYKISNMIEDINYELFDELIIETEFLNNNKMNIDDLNSSINFIHSLLDNNYNNEYQNYIYLIATFIITNKYYLDEFKSKSGLKRLLNNVIEMNSEVYYKNILPQINNFYVTDKIDGQRCIIIIHKCESLINIKLITNKLYQFSDYNDNIENNKGKYTILDSELIIPEEIKQKDNIDSKDLNNIKIYLFDIISYNNEKLALLPFEERYPFIQKGYQEINFLNIIECKEYIKLTNNYRKELSDFYNKKYKSKDYSIDGLIFTPTSKVINKLSKYPINTNYNNMIGYKWKPIDEITIDFYIKSLPKNLYNNYPYNNYKLKSNENIYILFSGISKQDFDKLNLSYLINYNKIIPDKFLHKNYFPIQFSTSDNPINYIYLSSDTDLDNKIGEFNYLNKKWNLKKIRYDRDIELERGEYFGNYFKIAELIWNNIKNPLTFDKLLEENTGYFLHDDNLIYKAQRGYNSFVKTYILENIINPKLSDKNNTDWIIDLAAGKGQDMARINNLGFKNGIFLDNDPNALLELINRKFNLKSQNKQNMKIFVQEINLIDNYKTIIKELEKFAVTKESIDVIICNFAIHYLINNEENLINLINLLNYYLKPNGRFIFTCFNGYKIFKLLENSNEWNLYENDYLKYSIKKNYKTDKFMNTGQKIDVLLPFSNTQYYTENLINLEYLQNLFNDNNFTTEISESFSSLFDKFIDNKLYNNLTKNDKEFIDLYQFTIIKKNYKDNIKIKSNIFDFFNKSGGNNLYNNSNNNTNNNLNNNYKLSHLDNINNSNSILIIINTCEDLIIKHIIKIFEEYNYKNKNQFKRNRNKIFKIICFNQDDFSSNGGLNNWKVIYNKYKENKKVNLDLYSSIIFYDYKIKLNEYESKYLIKTPILPIIINTNYSILITNNNDINNIINSNDYLQKNKYISNIDNVINILDNNQEILLNNKNIISDKYYDKLI